LENVRNFASHDKGHTWDVIRRKIDELNYYTYENPVILNTLYFGIPQSRERVVILCKRKDLGELEKLPKISKENIKETNLKSILEEDADNKYNINGKMKVTEEVWNEFLNICNTNKIDIPRFPIWTDWWDKDRNEDIITYKKYTNWIDKNQEFYVTNKKLLERWLEVSRGKKLWQGAVRKMEWQTGENNLNMREVLWSARGSGVRIKKCNYSPTLVAMGSMIPIYGPESRFLTKRECARLQSFPDDYIIDEKNAYKQFGNAVNVVMIERAARFMIKGEDLLI
jgi:DNA (cytosine-5)-methyltransferase 1